MRFLLKILLRTVYIVVFMPTLFLDGVFLVILAALYAPIWVFTGRKIDIVNATDNFIDWFLELPRKIDKL